MFRKIIVLTFPRKYALWRPLLPKCAACNLERFWRPTLLQIFSCKLFDISDDSNPTHWTLMRQYLTNINSKVLLNPITYDDHQCQYTLMIQYSSIWSFWHPLSFFFQVRNFFLIRNTLNSNHERNCFENIYIFSISLHCLIP